MAQIPYFAYPIGLTNLIFIFYFYSFSFLLFLLHQNYFYNLLYSQSSSHFCSFSINSTIYINLNYPILLFLNLNYKILNCIPSYPMIFVSIILIMISGFMTLSSTNSSSYLSESFNLSFIICLLCISITILLMDCLDSLLIASLLLASFVSL